MASNEGNVGEHNFRPTLSLRGQNEETPNALRIAEVKFLSNYGLNVYS